MFLVNTCHKEMTVDKNKDLCPYFRSELLPKEDYLQLMYQQLCSCNINSNCRNITTV